MNTKKRNVVAIVCDQLRPDFLSVYGADFIPTPNIDALAENGVVFENAITAATVCGPARASMFNGEFVSTHDGWTNGIPCKEGTEFLPERLTEDGYMTASLGEYDHFPRENMFGYQYRKMSGGFPTSDYYLWLKERRPEMNGVYKYDQLYFDFPEEEFYDRWTADRTIEFIESYVKNGTAPDGTAPKNPDSPFFVYCGFLSPHDPHTPPKEISGRVDINKLPRLINTTRREGIADVELNRRAYLNKEEYFNNPDDYTEERMKNRLAYAELIVEVDDLVGRIVQSLKDNGIYENTTIIFTSDHGSVQDDYNLVNKGPWPYKTQLFIPMIISNHPRLEKGTRCDYLCGNLDLGATVLDIAGDDRRFGVSRSMIAMANKEIPDREVNFSEFCDSCKTVVDKRFTFTYYPFTGFTNLFDRELYPDEMENLSGRPEYAEIEHKFLMHIIDFMLIAKGVRFEAHDLLPSIRAGVEKKDPKFLDVFDVAHPIVAQVHLDRIAHAGLPNDYNDFCKDRVNKKK